MLNIRFFIRLFLIGAIMAKAGVSVSQEDGKKLFRSYCASCHTAGDKKLVGPGLKGINEKRSEEWLLKWIKNSPELIESGDPEARAIFNEYNKSVMPPQNLNDAQVKAILAYVDEANLPPQVSETPLTETTGGSQAEQTPMFTTEQIALIVMIAAILIIIIASVIVLLRARVALKERAAGITFAARRRPAFTEAVGNWVANNKKLFTIGGLLIFILLLKGGWDFLAGIGISQGYQPDQPIQFSHRIHAGQNKISCNYCHSGASKSRTAGIPSANVCMNCHKYVREGALTGTDEIAKIYAALDYDPATQQYGDNSRPIEWIKVHNLPDLAYFNHSQHVSVGKIECQTCHGQVQEMDVVKQVEPLTMGWCVSCHKNTEVRMTENKYYEEFHKEYKEKFKEDKITVDKIGGLDCARCHY